jgi:gas vesicle protein
MKSFLFGLGIGLGIGVLFAPMSGEETRENISQRANDLVDQGRDIYEQGRERIRTGVTAIRNVAGGGQENRPTGTESAGGV